MRSRTLVTQVLLANLLLIVAAVVAAVLATDPRIDLSETPTEALVLGLAVALTIGVNVLILQRRFRPLERLVDDMERADLSRPGANLRAAADADYGGPEEVTRLHGAFRRMLGRLEAERRRASGVALRAQEEERARVARDLHDEVNQSLTGLLLRLEATRRQAPPELAEELAETQALANQAMNELLRLSRSLRPTALDDLGLEAAIRGLLGDLSERGIETGLERTGSLVGLPEDVGLVAYRITQEALNNSARHSGAAAVRVAIERGPDELRLTVADDGRGFAFEESSKGLGLGGMRERALLAGGELTVESRPGNGTQVSLRIPISQPPPAQPPPLRSAPPLASPDMGAEDR